MKKHPLYIVDVFAEEKYAGNQLAVIRNAKDLDTVTMQRIAQEMHFSETSFIESDNEADGGYNVRIFTPTQELPFAGHPTLGTAYIIQQEIISEPVERIVLNLKIGKIPVTFGDAPHNTLWMKHNPPVYGDIYSREEIAPILNLDVQEMDERFPIQDVSTGIPEFIVPLKALTLLKKAKIQTARYYAYIEDKQAKGFLIFCPETRESVNDLSVRFFADAFGVPEDPATGSANGCLAAYLVKHRYFGKSQIDVRVEQGHEIGRPSLLYLRAEEKVTGIEVYVGGKAVMVAQGTLV